VSKTLKIILANIFSSIVVLISLIILISNYQEEYKKYIVTDTVSLPKNTFKESGGLYFYRGFQISKKNGKPTFISNNKKYSFESMENLVYEINEYYISGLNIGIDASVVDFYKSADLDKSLVLSWYEIVRFQNRVMEKFKYKNNSKVLNPSEFYIGNGGDCDDFVSFTGGMLYYWGIDGYALIVSNKKRNIAHATLLVPADYFDIPSSFTYYDFTNTTLKNIPKQRYIVIDYASVGGFSIDFSSEYKVDKVFPVYEFIGMKY